jgi:hypothetical protein
MAVNAVAVPITLVLAVMTWLLIRSRSVRALDAAIVSLFGFVLASSVLGAAIRAFLAALIGLHAATGVPTAPNLPAPVPPSTVQHNPPLPPPVQQSPPFKQA